MVSSDFDIAQASRVWSRCQVKTVLQIGFFDWISSLISGATASEDKLDEILNLFCSNACDPDLPRLSIRIDRCRFVFKGVRKRN